MSWVAKEEAADESGRSRTGFHWGWLGAGGSFYKHLIIGYVDDLSIIAYRQTWETEDPKFQLCDHENDLSYWVGEIPTPTRAAGLLREHGEPLDE
jgi:hypothetical protein